MGDEPQPRFVYVNRQQLVMRTVDVEQLIEADHPARAIWEFLGRVELSRFSEGVQAYEGERGRAAYDPRLLVSLWLYSYSRGVTAGREIARLCETDPAYQWLTGLRVVNYHSLTDFRVQHEEALRELFVQILGVLSSEGLVTLERVMNDGTKIKAQASRQSFQGAKRVKEHLAAARRHVEALEEQAEEEVGQQLGRARERAARESEARLEAALREFEKLRAQKPEVPEDKLRVSLSEPEARKMKQPDGGYAPSYNVQITTDQAQGIIVAAGLSQSAGDSKQLLPAVARVKENTGKLPAQLVADGGYTSGSNIKQLAAQEIDFIAPVTDKLEQLQQRGIDPRFSRAAFTYDSADNCYVCPAGVKLTYQGREQRGERIRLRYRAPTTACSACVWKTQCCPQIKRGRALNRWEYEAELLRHKAKMETVTAQEIYKQRAQTAEFPIAWIKEKIGLRRFRLRGLQKAELEILWACATHNLQQWIRLCWKPQFLQTQTESSG
ncbi:MAG TPA: IS1182 family transposase [Pyrinomonadaceae bacterium]|nr:IS1182 family transposase [Pyrinomonadaceae bacterium]